jgi:hypothetical protein
VENCLEERREQLVVCRLQDAGHVPASSITLPEYQQWHTLYLRQGHGKQIAVVAAQCVAAPYSHSGPSKPVSRSNSDKARHLEGASNSRLKLWLQVTLMTGRMWSPTTKQVTFSEWLA